VVVDPDVAAAVVELQHRGMLSAEQAARLGRVARGELVSIRLELQALLYAGVLLVMAGVGLLVGGNLERIGPVTIALALGLGAAGCLAWVWRVAPAFSWGATAAPHLAFDYILLLGALLVAADLAYVETQFTPLGARWPWHLLIVSALYGVLSLRFDSRTLLALALTAFAGWRGVTMSLHDAPLSLMVAGPPVRMNAIGCGALFILLGWMMRRADRKGHFEPVAAHLGWLLFLGALALGLDEARWAAYVLALLLSGVALTVGAFRLRRFTLLAFGLVASYVALMRFVLDAVRSPTATLLALLVSSAAMVAVLLWAYRKVREPL
jgi:hypothetical protein